MIDYRTIGQKIRRRRRAAGYSQEQLAEMCNVGTTHISHIETGNCIPSLRVFVAIVNALSCSADELLSDSLIRAEHIYRAEISDVLKDCTHQEIFVLSETMTALKEAMRKGKTKSEC